MNTLDRGLIEFKLELSREWRMLQTHKWRRPKWVKFPRSMLDDARWIRLSDKARAAWIDILLIASEKPDSQLPEPDLLYRRLRALGLTRNRKIFTALIDELIQCNFLVKTSPESQSYRASELQSYRDTESQRSVLRTGDLAVADEAISEKRLGEQEVEPLTLGQPQPPRSIPKPEEMNGAAAAGYPGLSYAAALGSFRPVKSRFDGR
jgi:hypothetical protein